MLIKVLLLIFIFTMTSCSINRKAREFYKAKKTIKHGFVKNTSKKISESKKIAFNTPLSTEDLEKAEEVYLVNCSACHGLKGIGDGPMADSFSPRPKNLIKILKQEQNFEFFLHLSEWKGAMPGWKKPLNATEKRLIVDYLRFLALKSEKK